MLLIYLLLLGTVAKGTVATDPTTHVTTDDEIPSGPVTTSASFDSTSTPTSNHTDNVFTTSTASTTNSTAPVLLTTTESVVTESTSLIPTTAPSTRLTDMSTTSEAVAGNETDNSNLTTSSPPDFPSTPTNGTTTTNPENGQTAVTTTGITVLTTMTIKPTEPFTASSSMVTTVSPASSTSGTTSNVTSLHTTESTSNTTTAAPLVPTPGPPIVCPAKPCPSESICLNGTCQCISGTFMLDDICQQVQVFPGQLHLTSINFTEEMRDRSSETFLKTADEITSALSVTFQNDPGYLGSDVVELQPGSVIASVNNNFKDTSLTQNDVNQILQNATTTSTGILAGATFTGTNVCENTPLTCDLASTTCSVQNGIAVCSCKEGFIPLVSLYSNNRSCRACPSGQRAVRDTCEPCAFGYSGFNCNDSALLAVVVISCVLGGVLLLLVLALLIYCCWKCCSKDKPDYESSPYSSGDLNQPWPTGITPIPRATTNWDSGAIEMTEGGSTNNLVDKKHQTNGVLKERGWKKTGSYDLNPEDMKTFKGKNTSRYSYLVQGHENPYFLPGDDRKS